MSLIAIDWDGTLAGNGGTLLPGAREALTTLRGAGHRIIIHSCNNPAWIRKCLSEQGVPVDYVYGEDGPAGKPNADLYVDDRGYRFTGDWSKALKEITQLVQG